MKFDQNQKLTIATSQGCLLKAHHKLQPKYVNTQPSSWKHIHVQVTHPGCRNAVFSMLSLPGLQETWIVH